MRLAGILEALEVVISGVPSAPTIDGNRRGSAEAWTNTDDRVTGRPPHQKSSTRGITRNASDDPGAPREDRASAVI